MKRRMKLLTNNILLIDGYCQSIMPDFTLRKTTPATPYPYPLYMTAKTIATIIPAMVAKSVTMATTIVIKGKFATM
jgi:hypothetical protein